MAPLPNLETQARTGQHVLSLSPEAGEGLDLVASVFRAGLALERRCVYVAGWTSPAAVVEGLSDRGCGVERPLETGQLLVITQEESYFAGGRFDPDRMLGLWEGLIAGAGRDGFSGVCATGEAAWLSRGIPGAERWLEYDARINLLDLAGDRVTILCQLRGADLPAWMCAELEKLHPLLQRNGEVVPSAAYLPAERYLPEAPLVEELEPPLDTLSCDLLRERLSAEADDELSVRRRGELAAHRRTCPSCRAWAESVGRIKRGLGTLRGEGPPPPEGFWERIRSRLDLSLREKEGLPGSGK